MGPDGRVRPPRRLLLRRDPAGGRRHGGPLGGRRPLLPPFATPAAAFRRCGTNPFGTRAYRLAVLFEAVAIPVAAVVLNNAGYPGAVVSAVAAIVVLHFFGLVPAFHSRRSAAVGGAMLLIAAFSLLLPGGVSGTSPRGAVVGLGCAFVLWVGVLPFVLSTWREANVRSD